MIDYYLHIFCTFMTYLTFSDFFRYSWAGWFACNFFSNCHTSLMFFSVFVEHKWMGDWLCAAKPVVFGVSSVHTCVSMFIMEFFSWHVLVPVFFWSLPEQSWSAFPNALWRSFSPLIVAQGRRPKQLFPQRSGGCFVSGAARKHRTEWQSVAHTQRPAEAKGSEFSHRAGLDRLLLYRAD